MTIMIACDGSCIQPTNFRVGDDTNRPGAAGFVVRMPDGMKAAKAQPYENGLIGGMEVKALRMGLEFVRDLREKCPEMCSEPVEIICDSQYVVNGMNDWLEGWKSKGFHKKGGLAYADEWRAIDGLKTELGGDVDVVWVKAHTGGNDPRSRLNAEVDETVNMAARMQEVVDTTCRVLPNAFSNKALLNNPEGLKPIADLEASPAVPAPEPIKAPQGTLQAQVAALLAKAAESPQMASLLADGLEMAMGERRLAARYGPETMAQSQVLLSALEQRAMER
jgi:ribonuclease HI